MPRDAIMELLWTLESVSRAELVQVLPERVSDATLKRMLQQLVREGKLEVYGRGRATRYRLSEAVGCLHQSISIPTFLQVRVLAYLLYCK